MDLTPKQQTSEAIRQAETILITTGQHPSVDQVTAVIGLAMILRKFGKKVSAVISDSLPQSVQMLETSQVERSLTGMRDFVLKLDTTKAQVADMRTEQAENKLNIFVTPSRGNFAPSDVTFDYGPSNLEYDLAIILGVPTRARIDQVYAQNPDLFASIPVVNLDFHRSNENYGAVNLIEPNASSLCEMLVALSESLQGGIIDSEIATTLLMGIIGSTDRFTAAHTTSKSLTVAAQMMAAGARQQAVVRALYRGGDGRDGGRSDQSRGDQNRSEQRGDRGGDGQRMPREAAPVREAVPAVRPATVVEPAVVAEPAPAAVSEPAPAVPAPIVAEPAVVTPAPVVSVPAAVTAPAVAPEPAIAPEPASAEAVEPIQDSRPFRVSEELPIIDPGHIELSEPEVASPAPVAQPAADFAAAAEVLTERRSDEG